MQDYPRNILLFIVFVGSFMTNVLSASSSFSNPSDVENFVTKGREFLSDTVQMRNYLSALKKQKDYKGQVVAYVLMANSYDKVMDSRNDYADFLYREAERLAKANKDLSMSLWARMNFINNRYFFRDYEQLIPVLLSVMNDLQRKSNTKVIFPTETYKLIGWILQTMSDTEESLYYLQKALETAKPDSEDQATLLYSVGLHYFRIKNYVEAEKYFDRTAEIALKINDISRYAKVLGSKAEILEKDGKIPEAIELAKEDVKLSKEAEDEQNTIYSLVLLSRLYINSNRPNEAIPYLAEAEKIAYSKPYYISARRRIVMMKLELLDGQNAAKELSLLKELKVLEDSVKKADGEMAVRNSQYQIQKRKYEINLEKTKAAYRQKTNIYIIICIVLLFTASFIYWSYRNKLKNRSLAYDKLVLEMELEKHTHELKLSETELNLNSQIEYLKNKNTQIKKLNFEIQKLERTPGYNLEKKEGKLHALLDSHLMTDDNWKLFKLEFQKTFPDFYEDLLANFPDLTDSNLRIILLLNLGFSYSEAASLLGITSEAVRKSKQRMKKKYGEDLLFESLFVDTESTDLQS